MSMYAGYDPTGKARTATPPMHTEFGSNLVWEEANKPMLVEDGDSRGTLREKPGDGRMRRCPPLFVFTELTQG